jgi:multiple sugar transport system permease protein
MVAGRRKAPGVLGQVVLYAMAVLIAAVMLLPFVWMITTSLRSAADVIANPYSLVPHPAFPQNYATAFKAAPFWRYLANSLIVGVAAVLLSVLFSSMSGFGFAKYRFPGRNVFFVLVLSTLMVPFQMTMIPLYMIVIKLGLVNDLKALLIPFLGSAFGTFLMRQFISTIPDELMEAARIDGYSEIRIFRSIILPLSMNGLVVLALFMFMSSWDDFLWPLIVIDSSVKKTLPLGLSTFLPPSEEIMFGPLRAAATFVVTPILVLFVFLQQQMTRGIVLTGLKM